MDNAGVGEPGSDRGHRAGIGMDADWHTDRSALTLLVGLGAGEMNPDALVAELDPAVAGRIARRLARPGVETDQFGAAQRRGEAEQEQGAVAATGGGVGQSGEHGQDVGADRWSFRCSRGADHAADAAPDLADGRVSGVEGMPGDPVGLADGGEAALQGGGLVAGLGQLGQVEAEGFRCCWQCRQTVSVAEGGEVVPVRPVGPPNTRRAYRADYTDMIYGKTVKAIEARRKAFVRKWRLKCPAIAASLEEAGANLFTFLLYPP